LERKTRRRVYTLLLLVLLVTNIFLYAGVNRENISDYETIYRLQKTPERLGEALDKLISTMLYEPGEFHSEKQAEQLAWRIYEKKRLMKAFSIEDRIFYSIISEDTDALLETIKGLEETTDKYAPLYPLMEFVKEDFNQFLEKFNLRDLERFMNLYKLENFDLIAKMSGEALKAFTSDVIEKLRNPSPTFTEEVYEKLAAFGGKRFLEYLSIQIKPYINLKNEDTYSKQLSLLSIYIKIFKMNNSEDFEKRIPEEIYASYLKLDQYFDYLENVKILSRRILTAEDDTFEQLISLLFRYLSEYDNVPLKTGKLEEAVLELIKNASSRVSATDISYRDKVPENFKMISSNPEIENSFSILMDSMKPSLGETATQTKTAVKNDKLQLEDFELFPILIWAGGGVVFLFILYLFLPLKIKAGILKNLGLKEKALLKIQRAAIENPTDPDIHIKTAQLLERMDREEEAVDEYRVASKVMEMSTDELSASKKKKRDDSSG